MPKNKYMLCALDQAQKAFDQDEVPVGAVVVHGDEIICSAHNLTVQNKNPLAHAEMIAIENACALLGQQRLTECDLYVTLEPCPMCAQAILFARFRRVYFGAYDPKGGGSFHGPQLLINPGNVEVYGGILETDCQTILQDFFHQKR